MYDPEGTALCQAQRQKGRWSITTHSEQQRVRRLNAIGRHKLVGKKKSAKRCNRVYLHIPSSSCNQLMSPTPLPKSTVDVDSENLTFKMSDDDEETECQDQVNQTLRRERGRTARRHRCSQTMKTKESSSTTKLASCGAPR